MTRTETVALPELTIGQTACLKIGGRAMLLVRTKDGVHACSAICPHQNRSLCEALVRGESILCPWHGAKFDLKDGRSRSPLTTDALQVYACVEDGHRLHISLTD